ncbi:MAG: preprotein translocase subunit SecG [Burkholderiales bacterium]|nr:preprotein translocase subunit SecG [Burkholderiales bacterium]
METLVWILHIIASLAVIGMVLLQHGKGADMGAAFGSGSSGSLFGASGSANFLSRATAVAVTVFFLTSMGLTYFAFAKQHAPMTVKELAPAQSQAPAAPQQPAAPSGSKAKDIPN